MNFKTDIFSAFDKEWALLTAGSEEDFNTMTISWGGMGTLWGRPVATVYVRPTRYTYEFLEQNEHFTISFFPDEYKDDLAILGSKSGRDTDKLALTGITPKFVKNGVGFNEAVKTLVCKKIYHQDLDTEYMPPEVVAGAYAAEPTHRMYIGQVVEILDAAGVGE